MIIPTVTQQRENRRENGFIWAQYKEGAENFSSDQEEVRFGVARKVQEFSAPPYI